MILHADDFSVYGGNKALMLDGIYASIGGTSGGVGTDGLSLVVSPEPGATDTVIRLDGDSYGGAGNKSHYRRVLALPTDVIGMACRMWLAYLPLNGSQVPGPHQFNDNSNTPVVTITVDTTGRLEARRGDYNGTILGTSSGPVVTAAGFYHLETWINITTGDLEVRVEGRPKIELTGEDLGILDIAQVQSIIRPTAASSNPAMYIKDLVVCDDSGTYNNDFIGNALCVPQIPDDDVNTNWDLTGAATRHAALANAPPLDDTEYITAVNPPPAAYVAETSNLPPEITTVLGLVTYVRAAKTDGGDATLQVSLISDGTPVDGEDRPITTAMTYWQDVFEEDPDTAAPWTPASADAAQLQLNRTS